jgi:predicted PurR-regulated permease PerM
MTERWSTTARIVVLVSVLAGLTWFVSVAGPLIGPLTIAALLAYALSPAVTLVKAKTGWSQRRVVGVVYMVFLTIVVAAPATAVPFAVEQTRALLAELDRVRLQLVELVESQVTVGGFVLPLRDWAARLGSLGVDMLSPERVFRVIRGATSNLGWVLLILVTAFYLLRDWERLWAWLVHLAPEAYQSDVRRLHQEVEVVWQAYLRGQIVVMVVVGLLTGLVSAAIGLPGALALGLLAGLLDMVPSLGPAVTAVVAVGVAWFEGSTFLPISNFWFTLLVIGLYVLIQQVENVWVQPRVMSRRVALHPGLVFVAIVGSLALSGALVALISVPLLASIGVVGRYVHRRLLGLDPWPEDGNGVEERGAEPSADMWAEEEAGE